MKNDLVKLEVDLIQMFRFLFFTLPDDLSQLKMSLTALQGKIF